MLKRGQLVTVSGRAGKVTAEVIHTEVPADLPVVHSRAELSKVQAIMAERGVVQLALLAHDFHGPSNKFTSGGRPVALTHGKNQVMFCALLSATGEWRDLQGELLAITPTEKP
jgi:hypothetical protein